MKKRHDVAEVQVTIRHETEKAYLVDGGNKKPVWVSKSLCEFTPAEGHELEGILQLPEWLAIEKGLV